MIWEHKVVPLDPNDPDGFSLKPLDAARKALDSVDVGQSWELVTVLPGTNFSPPLAFFKRPYR